MTDLARRYGQRGSSAPKWLWPVIATIGVTIGVAWSAWVAWSDVPTFQARTYGFEVVSDSTTTVQIEIFRDEPVALTCAVYAQAENKAIVGETVIEVPASNEERTMVSIEITTEREATTGTLRDCTTLE